MGLPVAVIARWTAEFTEGPLLLGMECLRARPEGL